MQNFRPHLNSYGLTEQQWRVLRVLWEVKCMSNQQLSDHCVLHPASLSRIMPKLEADGLVLRKPTEEDRRHLFITITDKGRALVEKLRAENDQIFASIVEELGDGIVESAYDALERLNAGLERGIDRSIMTTPPELRRKSGSKRKIPTEAE